METLKYLVRNLVLPNAKALVAFAVTAVVAWLAQVGISLDADTQTAMLTLVGGLVNGLLVWFTSNE